MVGLATPRACIAQMALLGPAVVVLRVVEGLGHGAMVSPRAQEHLTLLHVLGGHALWRANAAHLGAQGRLLTVSIVTRALGLVGMVMWKRRAAAFGLALPMTQTSIAQEAVKDPAPVVTHVAEASGSGVTGVLIAR
jgi:hypothetical protein